MQSLFKSHNLPNTLHVHVIMQLMSSVALGAWVQQCIQTDSQSLEMNWRQKENEE